MTHRRRLAAAAVASIVALTLVASGGVVLADLNSAPTASDQTFSTSGEPIEITLFATDPDGDDLTFSVLEEPHSGTLSGTAPSFLYTPSAGFSGSDSFTWKASDGEADSNTATVSITGASEPTQSLAETTSTEVAFRASSVSNSKSVPVTSIAVAKPAGVVAGDVMLLHVSYAGLGTVGNVLVANPTVPAGWVNPISEDHIASVVHSVVWMKVAGPVEPASYTVTFGLPVQVAAAIGAWSGVAISAPIQGVSKATAILTGSVTVPSVAASAGGRLVGLFATLGYPMFAPVSMTDRWLSSTNQAVLRLRSTTRGGDELIATTGATGPRTANCGNQCVWIGHLVSLRPAP